MQDSLKSLQHNMAQLTDRVNKINDELTDIELLNGKLSDLKAMMKDIWKHQRRKSKKPKVESSPKGEGGGDQQEGEVKRDETKTEDDTFDDTTHAQTFEEEAAGDGGDGAGESKTGEE